MSAPDAETLNGSLASARITSGLTTRLPRLRRTGRYGAAIDALTISGDGPVVTLTMSRPARRNAFDAALIEQLTHAVTAAARKRRARVVILTGAGAVFSAGADLDWMRDSLTLDEAANEADALRLADMLAAIATCPLPVVARVNGAALGGGAGLVCAADIAVAVADAPIGFPEVRLGVIPAAISPFVVRRVGAGAARELFLTGRQVRGEEALRLGLVHRLAEPEALDDATSAIVSDLLAGGPDALRATKTLLDEAAAPLPAGAREATAARIARIRVSSEAQAGIRAFLARDSPPWRSDAS